MNGIESQKMKQLEFADQNNGFLDQLDKIFAHPFRVILWISFLIILLFIWCLLDEKEKYSQNSPNQKVIDQSPKFPFLIKYIEIFENWVSQDHAQGTSTIYFITFLIILILLYCFC